MFCPSCKSTVLQMSERLGIEIDYCPNCRGIWLDRGELDKIIEKNNLSSGAQEIIRNNIDHDLGRKGSYDYKYKRKKSFLEEIFD